MTDLPTIYNPDPVVIPASEFPDNYLISLSVLPPDRYGRQMLRAMFRPYNKAEGKLYFSNDRDMALTIPNIMEEVVRVPLFAQAMGAVITASSLGLKEKTLIEKIAALLPGSDEHTALAAELAATRAAMGIV